MEVYIRHERIIKSYADISSVDRQGDRETPLSVDTHKEVTPQTAKKTDITEKAVPLAEKIAAIADHVNKKDFNAALEIINIDLQTEKDRIDAKAHAVAVGASPMTSPKRKIRQQGTRV